MALPEPSPDTTVLITGASSGIGAELARELSRRGHHVTLVARRRDRLETVAAGLAAGADVIEADLGTEAARETLLTKVDGGRRRLAGLCNNAGYGAYGRFDRLPLKEQTAMVELNVDALHHLMAALLPGMVRRGEGAILNVASTAAYQPLAGMATYAATKAFVHSLSEAVHAELAGTGVSVTSLCPGPTKTEFSAIAGVEEVEQGLPGFLLQSAEEVARAGVDGMERGRRTVVPGVQNKASALGGRFVPRTLLLPLTRRAAGKRLRAE
jgi:uncharacterized protein